MEYEGHLQHHPDPPGRERSGWTRSRDISPSRLGVGRQAGVPPTRRRPKGADGNPRLRRHATHERGGLSPAEPSQGPAQRPDGGSGADAQAHGELAAAGAPDRANGAAVSSAATRSQRCGARPPALQPQRPAGGGMAGGHHHHYRHAGSVRVHLQLRCRIVRGAGAPGSTGRLPELLRHGGRQRPGQSGMAGAHQRGVRQHIQIGAGGNCTNVPRSTPN